MKEREGLEKLNAKMTKLTDTELNLLIVSSGLDLVLAMPSFKAVPIIHYTRTKEGKIRFITIIKKSLGENILK